MGKTPDVSIIVAAWNAGSTIDRAISSALAQTGLVVQVIAVDDASSDDTEARLKRHAEADPRLSVLVHPKNAGPAAARNLALSHATGQFVTILDADDTMEPDRLARLRAIALEGGWDIVADDLWKVTQPEGDPNPQRLWSDADIGIQPIDFADFVRGNLSALHGGRGELGFLKPLIRRDLIDRHDLRYDESMRLGEDYAFYATALARGARFCLTDPQGYFALVRANSLSGQHRTADLRALVLADDTLAREPGLSAGDRRLLHRHRVETEKRWRWLWLIDAVKARDPAAIARCFLARPGVIASLCAKLGEQAVLRSSASMRRALGQGGA